MSEHRVSEIQVSEIQKMDALYSHSAVMQTKKRKGSFQALVIYNKFDCTLKSVPLGSRFSETLKLFTVQLCKLEQDTCTSFEGL